MEYITKEDFKKQVSKLLVEFHKTDDETRKREIKEKIDELKKIRVSSGVEDKIQENPNVFRR